MELIRPATMDDAETLAAVIRESFIEYKGVLFPPNTGYLESGDTVRNTLAKGGGFLAFMDSEPVGGVLFYGHPDHLYLFRLAVLPSYRGNGLAKRLIAEVERAAQEKSVGCVRLMTRLTVERNVEFYARQGYSRLPDIIDPDTGLPFRAHFEKAV